MEKEQKTNELHPQENVMNRPLEERIALMLKDISQEKPTWTEQCWMEVQLLKEKVVQKKEITEDPARIIAFAIVELGCMRERMQINQGWICGTQIRSNRLMFQQWLHMHFTTDELKAFVDACGQEKMAPVHCDVALVLLHNIPAFTILPRLGRLLGKDDTLSETAVSEYFEKFNRRYGLQVSAELIVEEKGRFPLYRRNGKLVIVPSFFNHKDLDKHVRRMLIIWMYCAFYLVHQKSGELDVHPQWMAKGICADYGYRYITDTEMEESLRPVRRALYDDAENVSYFRVGDKLREGCALYCEVTSVTKKDDGVEVTVKSFGSHAEEPERCFSEEELYKRCCADCDDKNAVVRMRRNLFVVSGASGVGKDSVVAKLLENYPHLKKTISLTTRAPREGEVDGRDYYFVDEAGFEQCVDEKRLLENECYGNSRYGTLYLEIEKHPDKTPILLVIDVRGRRNVLRQYPMARTIFIEPPSMEELKNRLVSRGKNTEEEIEFRLRRAEEEMKEKRWYDIVVKNDTVDRCAQEIYAYIEEVVNQ